MLSICFDNTQRTQSGELVNVLRTVRWRVFLLCFAVWTLANMDQAIFAYVLPEILAEFHLPLDAAGTILTVSFVASALLVLVAGVAADRFGRTISMTVLLATSALFVGLQGLAGSIVMLTVFRALGFGLSTGLAPITNALITETTPARIRGIGVGLLQCGYPLGWFLASLFVSPLLQSHGWRAACLVAFAVIPLSFLVGWLLRNETRDSPVAPLISAEGTSGGTIGELFSPANRRSSIACAITFFAFGGAYAGSAFFFPSFFVQARGYSAADSAALVGLSNAIAIVGYIGASVIGEFVLARRTTFCIWCIAGTAALLGLLWVADSRTENLVWFGITAGLFYGAIAVLTVVAAEIFPYRIRATAMAVCTSAPLSLGFAVFPLVVPRAIESAGWEIGLTSVVAPLLLLAAGASLFLPKRLSGEAID